MPDQSRKDAVILVVDDEETNVLLLRRLLEQAGYSGVVSTTDPRQVLPLHQALSPDLILLDLHMPYLDGFAVLERLRPHIPSGDYLPVVVLTADITAQAKRRALAAGAKDFLTKPFDATEVLLRVHNLLETRRLHRQLQEHNRLLEERVRERTRELEEARLEILERLALAAEYRDDATGQHTRRVGQTAALLARALGLPQDQVELIGRAAPLHDIGKIGVPDGILLKPGPLTVEEFEMMKAHTVIGARILSGSRFPLLQLAEEIALTHHERWDGLGYPRGLRGEQIPLAGRIVAVADAFDAMTSGRPYRSSLSQEEVWALLWAGAGTQWEERLVRAFATVMSAQRPVEGVYAG
ncbi:MAG: response regulator [Armatimonadota bacterium]|nr:response regulator [Armatimonadota bacterium]MDR7427077.1 response regulator [Armatimonadota bacterium]MDR7464085.1 response regulator [Armatimonadota bacterium]MDR7471032.1 response regulator [Armatimonadota bacterium]MDR7473643.1 response regulator [Armatimonadota bacterium]